MKRLLIGTIAFLMIISTAYAQMTVRDIDNNLLMQVSDEGTAGSLSLPSGGDPSVTANKLYNKNGSLYWNGSELAESGSPDGDWVVSGSDMYSAVSGCVGIGDSAPSHTLDVAGKIGINHKQIIFLPDQVDFNGSLFLGDGGMELSHHSSNEGQLNTALGIMALDEIDTGYRNTAVGSGAQRQNWTGYDNTCCGCMAGYSNMDGHCNTILGAYADYLNNGGSRNTIIGESAGRNGTLKSGNIFIGYRAGYYETGDSKLYIENSNSDSPLIWGDFANDRVVINGNSTHNTNNRTLFINGSAGGTGDWNNDSDRRMKKNIETIHDALGKVMRLRGVNFEWKETGHHESGVKMGFIAQEAETVIPEVVSNHDDHYSMQYASITALLVEAVKDQQKIIEKQQKRIEALEDR
ncbi:tail fiber domain-containing protein [bacterium]|nr:tail fiber domain-containing protein [bacterium]